MAIKKSSKTQKAKPRSRVKPSAAIQRPTYAELGQQLAEALEQGKAALEKLQDRDQQLAESLRREKATAEELRDCRHQLTKFLEQQTTTSEILHVIASSPTNIQPVLDTVIANAVTLAGANHGHIRQIDGEVLRLAAHYNESPDVIAVLQDTPLSVSQGLAGRALRAGKPIQSIAGQEEESDFAWRWSKVGARRLLAVPLMKKGTPNGQHPDLA